MHYDPHLAQGAPLPPSLLFAEAPAMVDADELPQIPIMAATRLQLELLLGERSVDLKQMAEVILSDAGATLQVLRLIGEEYPSEEDRPTRIEDCIVSLNRERWYEVVCASGTSHSASLVAEWQHCRRVAEYARELARCIEGFRPEEAYMVGLLYRLGKFPDLLGWKCSSELAKGAGAETNAGEDLALSMMLAEYWHLPAYLLSAIQEQGTRGIQDPGTYGNQDPAPSPGWTAMLQVAHELAERTHASSSAAIL